MSPHDIFGTCVGIPSGTPRLEQYAPDMRGNHAQLAESENWADDIRSGRIPPPARLSRKAILVGVVCALLPITIIVVLAFVL
jgi:hypothetical protein